MKMKRLVSSAIAEKTNQPSASQAKDFVADTEKTHGIGRQDADDHVAVTLILILLQQSQSMR